MYSVLLKWKIISFQLKVVRVYYFKHGLSNSHFVFSFSFKYRMIFLEYIEEAKNDPKMCFQYLSLWVTGSNSKYFITFGNFWDGRHKGIKNINNCA